MKGWQRRARLIIGAFTLIFGSAVWLTLQDREPVEDSSAIHSLDPEAVFESTGTVVTQTTGDTRDFTVEAERQLTYADGASRLEDVTITVERAEGDEFVITGDQAEVGETESDVTVTGDVVMRASDGLVITTEKASYNDRNGSVHLPGYLEFSRGRLSGTAVGATYSNERELLRLLAEAHVTLSEGSGGRADVTSRVASLARAEHYMRFARNVQIVQEGRTTTAQRAIAYYDEITGAIEMMELRGQAQMEGTAESPGELEAMRARDINLTYDEGTGLLQHATLAGQSEIRLAGATAADGQRIAGEWIDAALGRDGATVTALGVRERVEVDLPGADGGVPRRVRSMVMEARGDETQGLTEAAFTDDVEYRELRSADDGRPDLVTTADRLDTELGGSLDAMASATFSDNVVFLDGAAEGASSRAFYDVDAGIIQLRPMADQAARPRVIDARTSVEADEIDLAMNGSGMRARGNVRSMLTLGAGQGDEAEADTAETARLPGMFTSDEPAYVTGLQLAYEASSGVTTYTGGARLWQGDTAVQGDQIELYEQTADLKSIGNARSAFVVEEVNEETQEVELVPTIASAAMMHYEDALRRATYTTEAHVNGPQGDLRGDRVELYFGASQHELERVESYQQVKLLLTDRIATGMQLTYFTEDGRYVMRGAPVQILEDFPDECRETVGKTLTFFRSTDTISVDGNEEVRTQTRTTGSCPPPQFH
ncbi:MAG TPA: LPS export ABC transporter periplasmic protein LptC [Acidobacteria bacterium]|jgi:LPS export ABC transporter protein LptC|nr:LPS export ABC transporter periplasmic protein LptC [Acidobacteriota bacterium]MDP6373241.1 LPS export ABC transporter periplasmic protein LptC [Vicinamibacterales bacterium]HAK56354.1 LPS export ABC transporter periplasmic protein LptC [Acidobacteriota bacterium]|tara:strand:- start:1052 stop:3196 length:2145 start_codon:yes stop_codon:yes gene_type:complete